MRWKVRRCSVGDLTYEIEKKLVVLSTNSKGWQKELNLVSWNNRPAKYDLREWSPEHDKMGKGVTLTEEEFQALKDALANM